MNLLVNGVSVNVVVAPFTDNVGHILIAVIQDDSEEAKALHIDISKKIRTVYRAVMDNSPYMEEGQVAKMILSVGPEEPVGDKKQDDEPQVRLLDCEPDHFVEMLKNLGFDVVQKKVPEEVK